MTGFDGGMADGLRRPVLPVESVIGGPTTIPTADPAATTPATSPGVVCDVLDLLGLCASG